MVRYASMNSSSSIQRQLLDVGGLERASQQLGELCQHQFGGVRIVPHQPRDGIQRVEQEVRMQLHLEGFDLGTGELHFELGRAKLPRAAPHGRTCTTWIAATIPQ